MILRLRPCASSQAEIRRAQTLNVRAPGRGDQLAASRQPAPRPLVGDAGRLAHHPHRLGVAVPVLEAVLRVLFEGLELLDGEAFWNGSRGNSRGPGSGTDASGDGLGRAGGRGGVGLRCAGIVCAGGLLLRHDS